MKPIHMFTLAVSCLFLSSCVAAGVAGGVAAGTAASQEGGLSRAARDARIQAEINDLWFRKDFNMFNKLDLTVNQGRVLVTGVVQNPSHRVEAIRLAWQPKGVVHVINEVKVADSKGIVGFATDTWITTRIRTALIVDKNIESINYTIDTVQGSVYLMGIAQNQDELNQVIQIARTTKNVKQVVSYVKLAGTPTETGTPPSNPYDEAPRESVDYSDEVSGEPIEWNQESVY